MVLAGEPLAVLDLHHLPGPWMERIEDPHLERQTPGIVTLVRPAPAKPTWQSPSPEVAFEPAAAVGSTTWSISSIGSRPKPATRGRDGLPIT